MKITKTDKMSGVLITLTGDEVALAIDAWLVANRVRVSGPRTTRVNGVLTHDGTVYVDESGFVIDPEGRRIAGRLAPPETPYRVAEPPADKPKEKSAPRQAFVVQWAGVPSDRVRWYKRAISHYTDPGLPAIIRVGGVELTSGIPRNAEETTQINDWVDKIIMQNC